MAMTPEEATEEFVGLLRKKLDVLLANERWVDDLGPKEVYLQPFGWNRGRLSAFRECERAVDAALGEWRGQLLKRQEEE